METKIHKTYVVTFAGDVMYDVWKHLGHEFPANGLVYGELTIQEEPTG
jgi:hypothetical protein